MLLKCIKYAFNNLKVLLKCKIFPPDIKKIIERVQSTMQYPF